MQKVDLPTSFTKLNENCGLPDIFTDYQIRHLGNPSGLPEILLKIDPCLILKCLTITFPFNCLMILDASVTSMVWRMAKQPHELFACIIV